MGRGRQEPPLPGIRGLGWRGLQEGLLTLQPAGRPLGEAPLFPLMGGGHLSPPPRASVPSLARHHQGPAGGRRGAAESVARSEPPVMSPCVCVCFALRPRCRCPPIVAVVTVTPAPPIVLLTYRCRLLVLESRSLQLLLSVCQSPRSDRELSETLVASPSLPV